MAKSNNMRDFKTISRSLSTTFRAKGSLSPKPVWIIGDWMVRGVDEQGLGKGYSKRGRRDSKIEYELGIYRVSRPGPRAAVLGGAERERTKGKRRAGAGDAEVSTEARREESKILEKPYLMGSRRLGVPGLP